MLKMGSVFFNHENYISNPPSPRITNVFARHQIWLAKPRLYGETGPSEKIRPVYILNPDIGYGQVLVCPISGSTGGLPIDLGNNRTSYIEVLTLIHEGFETFIDYMGVAPVEIQQEMDELMQFIIFGGKKPESYHKYLKEKYDPMTKNICNVTSPKDKAYKRIRSSFDGPATSDFHLFKNAYVINDGDTTKESESQDQITVTDHTSVTASTDTTEDSAYDITYPFKMTENDVRFLSTISMRDISHAALNNLFGFNYTVGTLDQMRYRLKKGMKNRVVESKLISLSEKDVRRGMTLLNSIRRNVKYPNSSDPFSITTFFGIRDPKDGFLVREELIREILEEDLLSSTQLFGVETKKALDMFAKAYRSKILRIS